MNEEKVKQILEAYKEQVVNIREALRIAEVPESLIIYYTLNHADLDKMIPEDVMKFYKDIKIMIVLYLKKIGFSKREIAKRLGGHTLTQVVKILEENK